MTNANLNGNGTKMNIGIEHSKLYRTELLIEMKLDETERKGYENERENIY